MVLIKEFSTYSKVGSCEAVAGGDVGGGGGVRVVGVDVGQQGGHACWHSGTQVLCGKAIEMPEEK